MNVSHEKKGLADVISITGVLNAETFRVLEETINSHCDAQCPRILVNVAKMDHISSAGVGFFIGIIRNFRKKGGDIRFCCMTQKVKRVFRLLDMDSFFQFHVEVDHGINSYN